MLSVHLQVLQQGRAFGPPPASLRAYRDSVLASRYRLPMSKDSSVSPAGGNEASPSIPFAAFNNGAWGKALVFTPVHNVLKFPDIAKILDD
jgi:hypothetical protein